MEDFCDYIKWKAALDSVCKLLWSHTVKNFCSTSSSILCFTTYQGFCLLFIIHIYYRYSLCGKPMTSLTYWPWANSWTFSPVVSQRMQDWPWLDTVKIYLYSSHGRYWHIFFIIYMLIFFLNNTQRKLRMQYINLPSLWKALPFIVMVKTPCAENN